MNRDRWITLTVLLLASAGIGLILGNGARTRPAAPAVDAAAEAHAAAGVTTGPEVSAAFSGRVVELEQKVQAAPDDRAAVLELARLLHDGHRTREALPHYRRAIALDPTDPVPHYDLAAAHGELGEWAEARGVLLARVEAVPTDATALYDLGVVEISLDDQEAAVAWWRQARGAAGSDAALRTRIDEALARVGAGPEPQPPR
jgi:Flp pilus assembly protein TadD